MTLPLVQFTAADAPLLLELSESIGWPHEIGDWQTTVAASQVFGHRAADGKIRVERQHLPIRSRL